MKPTNALYMLAGTLIGDWNHDRVDLDEIEFVFRTEVRPANLVAMIEAVVASKPDAWFVMADTTLTVEHWGNGWYRRRDIYLTSFPSLAEHVWKEEPPDDVWTRDDPDSDIEPVDDDDDVWPRPVG